MTVAIPKAKVLGSRAAATGTLYITDDRIGVGSARIITTGKHALADIESVEITGDVAAKGRAGKVAMFGVLGLAGKKSQDRTTLLLRLRDGNEAGYQVLGMDAANVRVKVAGSLRAAGVVLV